MWGEAGRIYFMVMHICTCVHQFFGRERKGEGDPWILLLPSGRSLSASPHICCGSLGTSTCSSNLELFEVAPAHTTVVV